ncbi:hypothetical protein HJFPF1_06472 [Paramyrothecium foliicola]|nr:hypothetical protein HJFPF1_06472 [Paramyrothecium foliicola]
MEAAAKSIQLLTQRILPEHPHHLSYFADWRYRHHPVDDRKRAEEWHHPRMQYLTLVSEADRGVLLTRSDYDMREEPPKPVPRDVSALAGKTGEKKKLSFSDYKNKKSAGAVSASPPEPSIQKKKDSERVSSAPTSASSPAPGGTTSNSNARSFSEARRSDVPRSRDPDSQHDGKQSQPRPKPPVDMRLPPKPPPKNSLPPRPPSPDNRKRFAESNDESRPQKRPRPESGRPVDEAPSSHRRDDDYRRRDRDLPSSRDPVHGKDSKPANPSSLPNGRGLLKGQPSSSRTASPASRPRDDSVNGVRPPPATNNRHTPTKGDSSKAFVPPLLSPLRLSFDKQEHGEQNAREKDFKKKREEATESTRQPKSKKLEPPSLNTKRQKSPLRLPALLSPTLPPEVEAELQRLKKSSPKTSDNTTKEDSHSQPTAKKGPAKDYTEEAREGKTMPRRRLTVILRVPRRLRSSFRRILDMSPQKDAEQHDSASETPQLSQARKRPVATSETPVSDSIAVKRPRTSEITSAARLPAPSTPSKKGSASMSRVSSTNSMAHTPGELPNATPSAGGSVERVYNGVDPPKADKAEVNALREKEGRLSQLGRQLKHKADLAMKGRLSSANANGASVGPEGIPKIRHALMLESIMAFMMGFQAQNKHRSLCNKTCEPSSWESLFPLMDFHQKEMRRLDKDRARPVIALLILLQTITTEEVIKCYFTYENPGTHINADVLIKHERNRFRGWSQLRDANARIGSSSLRSDNITTAASVDEVAETGVRILRKWCAQENVDWTPEINAKDYGGSR